LQRNGIIHAAEEQNIDHTQLHSSILDRFHRAGEKRAS
jgi:hypothetical protein